MILRRIIINFLSVGTLLAFYGYIADFIPNSNTQFYGYYCAILLTAIFIISFLWAIAKGAWKTEFRDAPAKAFFGVVVLIATSMPIFLMSSVHGLPSLITTVLGEKSNIETQVRKFKRYKRGRPNPGWRHCTYQLRGGAFVDGYPPHYCISKSYFIEKPRGINVKLIGKSSFFGFSVQDFKEVVEN